MTVRVCVVLVVVVVVVVVIVVVVVLIMQQYDRCSDTRLKCPVNMHEGQCH